MTNSVKSFCKIDTEKKRIIHRSFHIIYDISYQTIHLIDVFAWLGELSVMDEYFQYWLQTIANNLSELVDLS